MLQPIPITSPPTPGDEDPDGRVWWGHADRSDPLANQWAEASWVLSSEPGALDTHWLPAAELPIARCLELAA